MTPRLLLATLVAVLALPAAAHAQTGGTQPGQPPPEQAVPDNPCERQLLDLLCPDLRMSPPYDLRIDRKVVPGRTVLRAANSINSRGAGPAELFGKRKGTYTATAVQRIWLAGGGRFTVNTPAMLEFKFIPGQGRYWKYQSAAAFEIWRVDGLLRPVKQVRAGPKVVYCLRDLDRTRPMEGSPRRFYYPACSKNPRMRTVTLGTSVGWSDIYPAKYHEQWIDVTGLRGTFAFKHIADPNNGIWESDETNNEGITIVRLPAGRAVKRSQADADNPY